MTAVAMKKALKGAIQESLRENREDLRDLIAEVIEDVALAQAIREGESSKPVSRESVLKALRSKR